MIAANKIDLASDRQVDAEKGLSFAEEQLGDKTAYMETSGENSRNKNTNQSCKSTSGNHWLYCFSGFPPKIPLNH